MNKKSPVRQKKLADKLKQPKLEAQKKAFKAIPKEEQATPLAEKKNIIEFKGQKFQVNMIKLIDVFDQMARNFFVRGKGAPSAHYYLSEILNISPEEARKLLITYRRP